MKRLVGAALAAALGLLCAAPVPAAAGGFPQPPPAVVPDLLEPELFEGFEPIPPDDFGFSPDFEFFVFQDDEGLQVIRVADSAIVLRQRFDDRVEIGFDPDDNRIYLLDGPQDNQRLRFIDPDTGLVLFDRRFRTRPEVRTDFEGFVNVVVSREREAATILVFDGFGVPTTRLVTSPLVRWGINLDVPVVAFVDSVPFGATRIELINVLKRRYVLRERTDQQVLAGFEPFGASFVIGRPEGRGAFRVLLANAFTGRKVLNRLFAGPMTFGFLLDGDLLGVFEDAARQKLHLFRTSNGRPVFGLTNPGR
jgi:hypothetical protein